MVLFQFFILLLFIILFVVVCYRYTKGDALLKYSFSNQRLTPIRGVLVVLIIMHHVSQKLDDNALWVISEFRDWGGIVVGMFFFITGYGLIHSYMSKGESYLDGYFKRRFGKLLPAFILTNIVYLFFLLIFQNFSFKTFADQMLQGKTLVPTQWYVYVILFQYVAFYFIVKMAKGYISKVLVLMFVASFFEVFILSSIHWGSYWYRSMFALPIGGLIAYNEKSILSFFEKSPNAIFILIVIIIPLFAIIQAENGYAYWLICTFAPIPIALLVFMLNGIRCQLLEFVGRYSYEIYLVQGAFRLQCLPIKEVSGGGILWRFCSFRL